MRTYRFALVVCLVSLMASFIPGLLMAYTWERTFGGPGGDTGMEVRQTPDGGFIVAGQNQSFGTEACNLIKVDRYGNEEWNRLFWGNGNTYCQSVHLTPDGGFMLSGPTGGSPGGGGPQTYLLKTDGLGNEVWSRILTGSGYRSELTSEGGYIITGSPYPWGYGQTLLVKTDSNGIEEWRKTIASGGGWGQEVRQTSDGGYIIVVNYGGVLIKTDPSGNKMWSKSYGVVHLGSVQQAADGGYIAVGGDNSDIYMIRTDPNGEEVWRTSFGGSGCWGRCIRGTSDGGYIVLGDCADVRLIKLDTNENKEWEKTFGGSDWDEGWFVQETREGGYIMTGRTWPFGQNDIYLIYYADDKIGPVPLNVEADPNPVAIDAAIALTATMDDSVTAASNIVSAEYSLDGGINWHPMSAQDGTFDSPIENVIATIVSPSSAGVYGVCVRGSDAAGNTGDKACILLAVFNPQGGYVTGGGWITSPAGAYTIDPLLTGKATFGFVSKYIKGANVPPSGQTEFQFKVADLNFHSDSYEWLVVAGSKAKYKGVGTINGTGNYGFMLSAIDGQISGGGAIDMFRIKIWDKVTGNIIYDNQTGASDLEDPTTVLGGGNIVIHKE